MSDDYQYRLMNEEDEWYMGPNGEDPDDDNQENKNKNLSLEEKLDTMIADLEDQKKEKEDEKRGKKGKIKDEEGREVKKGEI